MKKLTSIVAGVILLFMPGCSSLSILTPLSIPKPYDIVSPIFPEKETKIPYDEIKQREKIVADSLEKNFPQGVIAYLKGDTVEEDRYVVFKLADEAKTLISTFYRFPSPKIKKRLEEFHLFHETDRKIFFDINAERILEEERYQSRIVINDFRMNGPKRSEQEDYIKFSNENREERILSRGKLTKEGRLVKNKDPDNLLLESGLLLRDYLKMFTSR